MTTEQSQALLRAANALLSNLWANPNLGIDTLRLMDDLQATVDDVTKGEDQHD